MKTMSFINWKGGVGKTTISTTIAYVLANMGAKVLFIDDDKQGNSSRWFDADIKNHASLSDIIREGCSAEEAIQTTRYPNIDIIAAGHLQDAVYEPLLNQGIDQNDILRPALEPIKDRYHICVTDNAPDSNIIIMNVMGLSDYIFAITELVEWAMNGVDQLKEELQKYNAQMRGHNSGITGVIINKYIANPQSLKMLEVLRRKGYDNIFNPYLRNSRSTAGILSTCINEHKCICETNPRCALATDIKALIKNMM